MRSDWSMVETNSERCCNLFSLLIKDKAQILETIAQHVHARQNAQDPGSSSDIEPSTPRLGAKIAIRPEHEPISITIDTLPTQPELLELLPEANELSADGLRRTFAHAVEPMGPAPGQCVWSNA